MTLADAKSITGGLSHTSKMPCASYNLPAKMCRQGGKWASIPGTVCFNCYARKGRYRFANVQTALTRRYLSLKDPLWVKAMVCLISKEGNTHFRWHDSGDIQSYEHLQAIIRVVQQTPNVCHWLPTKEVDVLREWVKHAHSFPSNLTVRYSSPLIDHWGIPLDLVQYGVIGASACSDNALMQQYHPSVFICPVKPKAPDPQDRVCGKCRACWNKHITHVSFHIH